VSEVCTVTGTLSNSRTAILNEAIPISDGPVRVTVETVPSAGHKGEFIARLAEIRGLLYASGYRLRSKEEVDAQIQSERDSWESG
jgi:hypothetical protein